MPGYVFMAQITRVHRASKNRKIHSWSVLKVLGLFLSVSKAESAFAFLVTSRQEMASWSMVILILCSLNKNLKL